MSNLYKLNVMYLILYLRFGELNSESLIGHQKDNRMYDNVNDDLTAIYKNEIYNISYLYKSLSTKVSLEQSIIPAQVIETTTPSVGFNDNYHNNDNNNNNNINNNILLRQYLTTEDSLSSNRATETEESISVVNDYELENLVVKFESNDFNSCFLDVVKKALLWWTFANGTLKVSKLRELQVITHLDLSYRSISEDDDIYKEIKTINGTQLQAFSVAYNNLSSVPQRSLGYLANSLKYLSLAGNQFGPQTESIKNFTNSHCPSDDGNYSDNRNEEIKKIFLNKKQQGTEWASFPFLPFLIELDISNCHIEYITKRVFYNLTNLERLYMSHNKILSVPFDSFSKIPLLKFLDLSFTNVFDSDEKATQPDLQPNFDSVLNLFTGLSIQKTTFKYLPNLQYLDLSHTKITKGSALAFTYLGENLQYLSLCHTSFPLIGNAIFKNTGLVGLDVSGNLMAGYNILGDAFEGIADSLKYLYFQRANLRNLSWLRNLYNLRFLGLADNNINSLTLEAFRPLINLQLLDLSSNQVGNWYNRVFSNNKNLTVLSLRNNNLNIITSEMIKDFSLLEYLSLGGNNFVCNCLLRQLVDVATENNNNNKCRRKIFKDFINESTKTLREGQGITKTDFNVHINEIYIFAVLLQHHLKKLKTGYGNSRKFNVTRKLLKMRFSGDILKSCYMSKTAAAKILEQQNGTNLKFQLLDYQDEHYYCFNETERLTFVELNCQPKSYVEDIAEQLNTLTIYIVIFLASIVGVSIIGFIIYWKRWYIHYYYSSFKTATLMSGIAKKNGNKFTSLADHNPNMIYDAFISYCQSDRDWILEQLMPNVEEAGDISICLHERDFQIGVTILDNIVSCMDRSRALMLIISADFLLSHWCQFEMHLAQHRIFDVSNDQLILVFLEDIPRSKRSKQLQYLMDVKTYIKWPGGKDATDIRLEERKIFWKRLKRSLTNIHRSQYQSI